MKNIQSFDDFVNEDYNDKFLFEGRDYWKEKNSPKLAAEYKKKVAEIVEEIAHSVVNLKGIQYAKNLTEIFGDEAKTWWTQGNPSWQDSNPAIGPLGGQHDDCKGYKADPSRIEFVGWSETTPWFTYNNNWIKAFIKTDEVNAVFGEWQKLLKQIATKHNIQIGEAWQSSHDVSSLGAYGDTPDTLNSLWWNDENGGVRIENKKPELGYSCIKLCFSLYLVPTPEEAMKFKAPAKMKPVWNVIKKCIEPDHTAYVEDQDDNPKWKIGKYELQDFIRVWGTFEASEENGVDWDLAGEITQAIHETLGGQPIKSQADFAVSGAEMRQAWQGTHFPYIVWDWDGATIYVPKQELKHFEALCKGLKIEV